MASYIIPPRLRNSDYQKGAITQDEYLRVAAANDANIAAARKAYKSGEVAPLTASQKATTDEILADIGAQESAARSNLLRLGFRDQDAARITADLMNEQDVLRMFNMNFPAIDADIKKRFNPRLITPTFFLQYLREYNENIQASRGLDINSAAVIRRPVNAMINTVAELRRIVPDRTALDNIVADIQRSGAVSRDVVANIAALRTIIPTEAQLRALQAEGNVERMAQIQRILDGLANVPTRAEIDRIARDIRGDVGETGFNVVRQNQMNLQALANAVPSQRTIVEIRAILDQLTRQPQAPIEEEPDFYDAIEAPTTQAPAMPMRAVPTTPVQEDEAPLRRPVIAERVAPMMDLVELEQAVESDQLINWYDTHRQYYPEIVDMVRQVGSARVNRNGAFGANQTLSRLKIALRPAVIYISQKMAEEGRSRVPEITTGQGLAKKVASKVMRTIGGELRNASTTSSLKKIKLGKGISVQETPTYKEFGKYAIHMPQLEQQDILNVKYKSLGGIPKFKPFAISDIFRDFLLDVLDGKRPSERVYLQIEPKERKIFEDIAIGAGVWTGLGLKRTTTNEDEEDAKRFEVLKGIYMAGNNSPQVSAELRRLVTKFINNGKMKRQQGLNLLMELSI